MRDDMKNVKIVIKGTTSSKHRPSAVNSYQRYQDYTLIHQTRVSST